MDEYSMFDMTLMYMRHVNMDFYDSTVDTSSPIWTGEHLHLFVADGVLMTTSDLLHEVAHWVVATEDRRQLPNFGLGPDPWMKSFESSRAPKSAPNSKAEEEQASVLGIQFERIFGLPWWNTAMEHCWVEPNACPLWKATLKTIEPFIDDFREWYLNESQKSA